MCVCSESDWTNSWKKNLLIEMQCKGSNFQEVSEEPAARGWLACQGSRCWILPRLPVPTAVRDRMLGGINSQFHPVWLFLLSALSTFKFTFSHYLYKSTAFNARYVYIFISPQICYGHLQIGST